MGILRAIQFAPISFHIRWQFMKGLKQKSVTSQKLEMKIQQEAVSPFLRSE